MSANKIFLYTSAVYLLIYLHIDICRCLNTELMVSYTDSDAARVEAASNLMKAIAHPIRLSILSHLADGKSFTVTEIHKDLGVEQSTASHHLGILKDKGVLISRKEGKQRYYSLKNKNLKKLVECVNSCACIDEE